MTTAFTRFSCSYEGPRQHATGGQKAQHHKDAQAPRTAAASMAGIGIVLTSGLGLQPFQVAGRAEEPCLPTTPCFDGAIAVSAGGVTTPTFEHHVRWLALGPERSDQPQNDDCGGDACKDGFRAHDASFLSAVRTTGLGAGPAIHPPAQGAPGLTIFNGGPIGSIPAPVTPGPGVTKRRSGQLNGCLTP